MDPHAHRNLVRRRYAGIAEAGQFSPPAKSSCCGGDTVPSSDDMARRMGYSDDQLSVVPDGSNLGLGCGNPAAIAALRPGQVVVDLGSGAGFDCFLAARQVGPSGQVIGIDMTPEMLAKARRNAQTMELANVEFRLGEIEHLPVADDSVDVIISNCVINLSPDKPAVFREAFRVLRSGGRLAVSDVVAMHAMPDSMLGDPQLLCGCVAGAVACDQLETWLAAAGFHGIAIEADSASGDVIREWAPGRGVEDFLASARISAYKP